MRRIDRIVVHCSDSPHRGDTAADIHRWHLARGWAGIGYHYVIREDGTVDPGRPLYWIGSHVKGANGTSIGICLLGVDKFTSAQFWALRKLIKQLVEQFPGAMVFGHNDLDKKKDCPNFDVKSWWAQQ